MRDFADELDRRLQHAALAPLLAVVPPQAPSTIEAPVPTAAPRRKPSSRRRPTLAGGVAAALTVAVCGVMLSGTSIAGLPILETATTDASALSHVPELVSAKVDFGDAHAFGTRGGPGFVLTDVPGRRVCISIPDPASPGDYAGACSRRLEAERHGLLIEIAGDLSTDPNARNDAAFVLPLGAKNVRIRRGNGPSRPADVESGVVVASIAGATTITYVTGRGPGAVALQGAFDGGSAFCDHEIPAGAQGAATGDPSGLTPPGASAPLPAEAICP